MSKESKKILVSGVQPTGRVHIGNYFGAMKQFVELQDQYESYIFIADYHAMTTVQDKAKLMQGIIDVALDYLAIGLDPKKVTLFKQSDVPQVTELTWMFNCLVPVSYLLRAHAFKSHFPEIPNNVQFPSGKLGEELRNQLQNRIAEKIGSVDINTGLLDYPLLMASDILIQDADVVPVGQDQKQHVEYARDTAQKFNNKYGETFKMPESLILSDVETVPGIDGRKMSKSYDNVIPLFATDEEIKKAVMKIPTDSKGVEEKKNPDDSILFSIHKLFLQGEELKKLKEKYEKGGMGYKEAKELLIKDISDFIRPMREKREMLAQDMETVFDILKEGGKRAQAKAEKKMKEVREKVGLEIY